MAQKLTDMQLVLLATACQREDGSLLPPPTSLGDQAARIRRAVAALIKRGLAGECDIADGGKAWRDDGDRHIGVVITDAGRTAIAAQEETPEAMEQESRELPEHSAAEEATLDHAPAAEPASVVADHTPPSPPASEPRTGSKQALVLGLLQRDEGASIAELVDATGWLPHTTRAALTGLRKKGHDIAKAKRGKVTIYRIAEAA